jgi:hypothetical protein
MLCEAVGVEVVMPDGEALTFATAADDTEQRAGRRHRH